MIGCCKILTKFNSLHFSRLYFLQLFTLVLCTLASIKNSLVGSNRQQTPDEEENCLDLNNQENRDQENNDQENSESYRSIDSDGDEKSDEDDEYEREFRKIYNKETDENNSRSPNKLMETECQSSETRKRRRPESFFVDKDNCEDKL